MSPSSSRRTLPMPFTEAKEHAPGSLHEIFADPYSAFDNMTTERLLHLRVAIGELVRRPIRQDKLVLRIIHGWENGGCSPETLCHRDYRIASLDILRTIEAHINKTLECQTSCEGVAGELLGRPLTNAICSAQQAGMTVDNESRQTPSRWPSFTNGLWLYTMFKVYHRLIYGEDDPYRSIHLRLPEGEREVHEFHLEEGEFAVMKPREDAEGDSMLLLHPSQLSSVLMLLEQTC